MNANIRNVIDHGHSDERIIIDITDDCDIGVYMVLDTTYTKSGGVSNKVRHPYWFPDQDVKAGDVVVLYTRKGNQISCENKNGSTSYFYFWGLDNNVWNNEGDCALLMHVDDWTTHKITINK